MLKKGKYNIMSKALKGTYKNTISMIFKIYSIQSKYENKKIDSDSFDFEMAKIINEMYPTALAVAHIGYENNKDLQKIDKTKLYSYLESKKIGAAEFSHNYARRLTTSIKILLFFAILDKENISLPNLNDPELAVKLLEGQGIDELYESVFDQSLECQNMIFNVFSDDFNINDLTIEQKSLLDSYHENYMNKNIYPKVTDHQLKEKTIMGFAKSLGKPKTK